MNGQSERWSQRDLRRLVSVDDAMVDRLWCAIDDRLQIGDAPPSMALLREALTEALHA